MTAKILITAAVGLFMAATAHSQTWIALGSGPASEGGGTSLAFGTKRPDSNLGWGLGFVFNSEFADKNLMDYPVPHSSYTSLGSKRVGNAIGLDGYYFLGDSISLRPYVGMGIYRAPRKQLARSNVTGWYYTQSDDTSYFVSGELGLQFVSDGGTTFGLGYHTIRGSNISIGKSF
jgi:hypothetical protein